MTTWSPAAPFPGITLIHVGLGRAVLRARCRFPRRGHSSPPAASGRNSLARTPRNLVQMQISLGETGDVAKAADVGNGDMPFFAPDQALAVQRPQDPIDVDGCEAGRVGKLFLRHWQLIAMFIRET